ncbi:fungal-specific transcription factor domain-containing protein [Peziza echinospora]|nr:fungal-specific transcription factor domain-containing protein [Peziza echinospora]
MAILAGVQQPAIGLPPVVANASSAPRKRRRRAPATGAAEDCFTCRANATKCDRRRPYCGPCLEIGNECKGYRTQLTWNVGVASRGKLRGMTLPIAIESNISVVERDRQAAARKKAYSLSDAASKAKRMHTSPSTATSTTSRSGAFSRLQQSPQSTISSPFSTTDMSSMIPTAYPSQIRHQQHRHAYPSAILQYHKVPSYQNESISSQSPSTLHLSPTMTDYDAAYDSNCTSSYSVSPSPSDSTLYDVPLTASSSYLSNGTAMTSAPSPSSYAPLINSLHQAAQMIERQEMHHSHSHSHQHWQGQQYHQQSASTSSANLSDLLYADGMLGTFYAPYSSGLNAPVAPDSAQYYSRQPDPLSHTNNQQIPPQLIMPHLSQMAPEYRYLVDYYDKIVCPSIVAFDGPSNPYRMQVLRLAFNNDALMQAVYALSSSHLQQRKKAAQFEQRRSTPPAFSRRSLSHSPRSSTSPPPMASLKNALSHQSPTYALRYKNSAIKLLNGQLADSSMAVTDTAMATLLILLLYHVCETGIGQFKTHLAGVKKLMSMRGVGKETGKWGWMETVFTWFDNMSAPVNNREAQLRGGYLDMVNESTDDWGLESLTGCNRNLFMRLAGLGRINMLSQMPATPATTYFKNDPHHHHHGSSGCETDDDEDDDDDEPLRNEHDGRHEFWRAWNAMKRDLYAWKPNTKKPAPISSTGSNKAHEAVEKNHWLHSSNVYRYAAILYLDRLAYPHIPSSHPLFQNTVRAVLDHLNCIPATSGLSKSLMWPLFLAGAECVVDEHRMLIRERCFEMQREGGFCNKLAGLDVLECIWNEDKEVELFGFRASNEPGRECVGGRGLKWRRFTQMEDGEYLMI